MPPQSRKRRSSQVYSTSPPDSGQEQTKRRCSSSPHAAETHQSSPLPPSVHLYPKDKKYAGKTPPCYSRTCPVLISHPGSSGSYEGLAIIDDQSSISFVDPAVGQVLDIPVTSTRASTQSTITIEGQSRPQPCKIIHGLIITPLDGRRAIKLPPVVMQHSISDSVHQVPSPEDVADTVGFQHLAGYFPKKNPNWPTLLLIGRDCLEAQWQEQYYPTSENPSQMVFKTPLGWTLVGSPPNS